MQQYLYIKVEMIMNIQHYVPMLSLDKLTHSLFRFSPFLSGTVSLHEHCRIISLMVCFRGPRHLYYILSFSLRKVIIQAMDVFAFPDEEKQP